MSSPVQVSGRGPSCPVSSLAAAVVGAIGAVTILAARKRKKTFEKQAGSSTPLGVAGRIGTESFSPIARSEERAARETASPGYSTGRLLPCDAKFMALCAKLRDTITPPIHSNFLACAVISFWDKSGKRRCVKGVNGEACPMTSCLCAERSAMLRLPFSGYTRLDTVYITCSASMVITPGLLCRQWMSEFADPDLRLVLFSRLDCRVTYLRDLYPDPPLYRRIEGDLVRQHAVAFAGTMQRFTDKLSEWGAGPTRFAEMVDSGAVLAMYKEVIQVAAAKHITDVVYPFNFGAGILFSDGSVHVTAGDRLIEYGCSLDACCKLVTVIEMTCGSPYKEGTSNGVSPLLLLHADAEGVLHAPSAQARSYFYEFGFDDMAVAVHRPDGSLNLTNIDELVPDFPKPEDMFES